MLNFTLQAIEEFEYLSQRLCNNPKTRKDADTLKNIAILLHQSIKFELPDGGEVIDRAPKDAPEFDPELLRLPFSVIALEFLCDAIHPITRAKEKKKRIILALDIEPGKTHPLVDDAFRQTPELKEQGCIAVFIIPTDTHNNWAPQFRFNIIPKDPSLDRRIDSGDVMSMIGLGHHSYTLDEGFLKGLTTWSEPMLPVLKEAADSICPPDPIKDKIEAKTENETVLNVVGGLLTVLSCRNINIDDIPAPDKLNKKRARKGKRPFYAYKTINVSPPEKSGRSSTEQPQFRNSPRQHLRRGHPRTYQSGLRIWVQSTMVGSGKGPVSKTYKIK